jgi:hypothetical protein
VVLKDALRVSERVSVRGIVYVQRLQGKFS